MQLIHLDRPAYVASVASIVDLPSRRFAAQAQRWWDRHYSWKADGCVVLEDGQKGHVSYIFYKIDRYGDYLTVHNLFTPEATRRNGFAAALLDKIFEIAVDDGVRRVRFDSISASLDFYLDQGFVYWGMTGARDYCCDLPLPKTGLDGIRPMARDASLESLLGERSEAIYAKVCDQEKHLNDEQTKRYLGDTRKMGQHYLYRRLQNAMLE